VAGLAGTNELDIAREALRDGLWNVARSHASRATGDTAKLVVLETYAQEGNWKGLLAAIDAMGYPTGDGFTYYRAVALFNDGSFAAASNALASVTFADPVYKRPTARLRAEIALANHDSRLALSILDKDGGDDIETKMLIASIRAATGDKATANALWRAVAVNTNASERVRATAAAGMGDIALLKKLAASARSPDVRRFAAFKLGERLVKDAASFAEGEKTIRAAVRDKPDAQGAREAFMALAEAYLEQGDFARAERAYADALEMWPEASKDAVLHEGRGWALGKLGRTEEALEAFRRAEELSSDAEHKAAAAVKVADILAKTGREKEATAAYQRVRDTYPTTDSAARIADVVRLREMEEKGRALYAEFKFAEARRVFEALAKDEPSRGERLSFYCVLCAYGAGDDERAEATARKLAADAKDPAVRADATHWLAKFAFNRGHWKESEALFLAYAKMSPKAPDAGQALVWSARAALANHDFQNVITTVTELVARYPDSHVRAAGMLAQGEALIELGRFDEAVLVLDRAALVPGVTDADRLDARILRADALFAMGADNAARYVAALEAYNVIRTGEALTPGAELSVSFKIARTLEKLKRIDEAIDMYYTQVVLAYRTGRVAGTRYDESARAIFARAAFRLAEEYESRGRVRQAVHVLDLVRTSDVQAAAEAARRIERLEKKGVFQ